MTQLQIKKADKQELAQLIEWEKAAYKGRWSGNDYDYNAKPNAQGNYPRKFVEGAVEKITERSLIVAMGVLETKLAEGYTLFLSTTCAPEVTRTGAGILYVSKPEAVQAEELARIAADVTSRYEASIEYHNEKVFDQERKAMLIEEAAAKKAKEAEELLQAEAKEEADIEKRVQARIRGMKAAK